MAEAEGGGGDPPPPPGEADPMAENGVPESLRSPSEAEEEEGEQQPTGMHYKIKQKQNAKMSFPSPLGSFADHLQCEVCDSEGGS